MKHKKAFTLIELLVVIAIIALLLAILMPALRAARGQARKTVCKVHVAGVGLALRMYADDHEGKTHNSPNNGLWDNAHTNPAVVKKYGANESLAYWGIAYFPYAENKKIYACPAAKRVDDWPEWGEPWGKQAQHYFAYCSYGLNGYITDENIDTNPKFKRPSEVIAFQDHIEQKLDDNGDMFHIRPGNNINLPQWRNGGTLGDFPNAIQECFRHRGISMTVWLDGHVSEIAETTGEDIPRRWYLGKVEE
ncbi:MAG: prepilin-type N-terminal cleavage/methylation domain-containing protein [Planctomycetes bacterium]|nr:prepilin-type N-terminal cleavage/methylation domain-containing protein [Planctomycetota bacterium]